MHACIWRSEVSEQPQMFVRYVLSTGFWPGANLVVEAGWPASPRDRLLLPPRLWDCKCETPHSPCTQSAAHGGGISLSPSV